MKTYRIHLLRHGQTQGNAQGQYIGSTDLPLTDEGIAQLIKLKEEGDYPYASVLFSSPLGRCLQTASILYPDCNPIVVDDFRECDFGEYETKTATELADDARFSAWLDGGIKAAPPGGESTEQFVGRCAAAFEKLVDGLMKTGITDAAVCAHGGVICAILWAYGLPEREFYDWMCGNGRGYTLRVTPGIWTRIAKAEVTQVLPIGAPEDREESQILDTFRAAAHNAQQSLRDSSNQK